MGWDTVQTDVIYRTKAIGKETVFLAGYERFENRYDYDASSRILGPLDLVTGTRAPAPQGGLTPAFAGFSTYAGDAVYAQVFSQLTDKLSVLAGLRQDWQTNDGQFNGQGLPISGKQLSPRVGATYYLTDDTILFGNWGTSFAPNFAFDINGDVFKSDQIRQLEFGIRQKLFGDRALLTVAGYDIRRSNVVIPDIKSFGNSIAAGRQSSRGAEIDLTGRLAPGLDAIATYAYIRTRADEPGDPNFGQQLAAVPEHGASFFLRYSIENGSAKGLSMNAGLTWQSRIQASLPNSIVIPANARLDLGVAYTVAEKWRIGVNVNNVTNSRSYITNLFALYPQAPRQFVVTLGRSFGSK